MTEHTFLVAVTVEGDQGRAAAELALHRALPMGDTFNDHEVTEWWIAEDYRLDGSDNEAAIFIPLNMTQGEARRRLRGAPA